MAPSRMIAPVADDVQREVQEGAKKKHVWETTCRRKMVRDPAWTDASKEWGGRMRASFEKHWGNIER